MTTPVFPLAPLTNPAFSVHRRPTYNSISVSGKNLRDFATYQQQTPLWEFELKYEILRDKTQNIVKPETGLGDFVELQQLAQLYLACAGPYGEFFFDDWTDNSRTRQALGVGDGATTTFTLLRTISNNEGLSFTEAVGGANLNYDIIVYLDDVEVSPTAWDISSDLRDLVFTTPPAENAAVSITFYYYYRCRFLTEEQEFEEFLYNRWSVQSLKFRNISDGLINPLSPFIIPPPPIEAVCLNDFDWYQKTEVSQAGIDDNPPCRLDYNGNYYWRDVLASPKELQITDGATGTLLATYVAEDISNLIDAWYGSAIVLNTLYWPDVYFNAAPVYNGRYVLAHMRTTKSGLLGFAYWWALCDPAADGTLTVLGAIYYNTSVSVTAPPYTNGVRIYDAYSTSNPLYIGCYAFLGAFEFVVIAIPSIDEFLTNAWASGWSGTPLLIRCACFDPVGNANLSDKFMQNVPTSYTMPRGMGFLLPDGTGGVSLYQYMNRAFLDATSTTPSPTCPEIKNVIQPAYPYGCIVKIPLGNLSYFDLASSTTVRGFVYLTATASYTIDNVNWQNAGGLSVIPFTDEYTYISTDAPGGIDGYSMQIGGVQPDGEGKYWVTFYMEGHDDYVHYATGNTYTRIRVFKFDPATQIGTQFISSTCILHTDAEIPHTAIVPNADIFQTVEITGLGATKTVVIYPIIYKVNFCEFTVP